MRVLHVLDSIEPAGGGPVEAARLYCTQKDNDYRPEVLSLDANIDPWRGAWPVPVHAVGRSRLLPRYSAALVPWLNKNAGRFDCAVVHCVWGYHLIGVWRAFRSRLPYFLILHGSLNPWFRETYPQKHLKKRVFWWAMTGRAVAGARAVFYLCPEEKRVCDPAFPIRSGGEAFVPLGTYPRKGDAEAFLERFPHLRGKRILLFLGRICYMKGCDILVSAFAQAASRCPEAHLVMCGPDQEGLQRVLMRRAEQAGIADRVTWAGPLFGDERWPAFAAAEIFVLPSRCETFPVAVLEALACGTPVLLTRRVNIYPEIASARAGFICDATEASVADAIAKWLSYGSHEVAEFSARAALCQTRSFDLRRAIDIHAEAVRTGLSERGARSSVATAIA